MPDAADRLFAERLVSLTGYSPRPAADESGPRGASGRAGEEAWREEAACAGMDPALFFPAGERAEPSLRDIQAAKRVCASCPVRQECLDFALATSQPDGLWGGLTTRERRRLRRTPALAVWQLVAEGGGPA